VIPGKTYKPEDALEAAWRRRWVIVAPFVLLTLATIGISMVLPDRYRAEATLLIVPQRVPENYVKPTVTTRLDERLRSIGQQILTRTQLERIMQEFNLYPEERRTMIMEDVIEMMKTRDIDIGPPRGGAAGTFTVAFEAANPRTAMIVTERLASLFIRQNLEDRSAFAEQTDQFLESQLEESRRKLKEHEAKLEAFKRENPGRMPEEMQANQMALTSGQGQLQALQETIYRDRDRQLMLQQMINDAKAQLAALQSTVDTSAPAVSQSAARQLEAAKQALRIMSQTKRPDHPDIRAQQRLIRDLEQKAAAEALQQPVSATAPPASSPGEAALRSKINEMQAEHDQIERRLATKQESEKQLLAGINAARERLGSIPSVSTKLTELTRDYTTLQAQYQSLLAKSQEAKIAANMERREIGEQFKIIDPPRLPPRPASPNRPRMNMLGSALGLAIGLALAMLLEYRDTSLRSEEDVLLTVSLPVLAFVPTMVTAAEREKRRRTRFLLASSGLAGVLLSVAVIAWKFRDIATWIR
jgi:polysaccharide chain length determinant protein (PEP-CTERM system associated)